MRLGFMRFGRGRDRGNSPGEGRVVGQRPDERMLGNEVELGLRWLGIQQGAQIAQAPRAEREGAITGAFQFSGPMVLHHRQESLEDPDAGGASLAVHGAGPATGGLPHLAGPVQQPVGAALDDAALAGVDVGGIGAEGPGIVPGVQRDQVHLSVENAHQARFPADQEFVAEVVGSKKSCSLPILEAKQSTQPFSGRDCA
jgi:hypothetical protein